MLRDGRSDKRTVGSTWQAPDRDLESLLDSVSGGSRWRLDDKPEAFGD